MNASRACCPHDGRAKHWGLFRGQERVVLVRILDLFPDGRRSGARSGYVSSHNQWLHMRWVGFPQDAADPPPGGPDQQDDLMVTSCFPGRFLNPIRGDRPPSSSWNQSIEVLRAKSARHTGRPHAGRPRRTAGCTSRCRRPVSSGLARSRAGLRGDYGHAPAHQGVQQVTFSGLQLEQDLVARALQEDTLVPLVRTDGHARILKVSWKDRMQAALAPSTFPGGSCPAHVRLPS